MAGAVLVAAGCLAIVLEFGWPGALACAVLGVVLALGTGRPWGR